MERNNTGPKWQWSNQQASPMSIHGSSQMSSPGQFRPVLLPWVSKIDDKERCFLK